MSATQWLLGFHVLGALAFIGAAVTAGVLQTAALRRERPSEIAVLLRLTRPLVATIVIGALVALVFGLALVHRQGFSYGDGWISGALVLWVVSLALGGIGGRGARSTRELAERLAAEGDRPSAELHRALRDPAAAALNFGSFLAAVAILALMIWK